RGVGDRFATTELHVARRQGQGVSAELERADFEGDARACARLHEDHGERFSCERLLVVRPRAHSFGQSEQTVELLAWEVGNGEKVSRHHRMYLRRSSSSTMALSRSRTR